MTIAPNLLLAIRRGGTGWGWGGEWGEDSVSFRTYHVWQLSSPTAGREAGIKCVSKYIAVSDLLYFAEGLLMVACPLCRLAADSC
jgi:hypothetical protein